MKRDEIEQKLKTLRIVKKNLSKLNTACAYGYTREVTNLISQNYQIDGEDENCVTPLIVSCMLGYTRLPELLIEKGADVNKPNKYGVRPLHMAACYGHVSTVQLLLQYGADKYAEVNEFDGATPIDFTVHKYSPNYDKIRKLLA